MPDATPDGRVSMPEGQSSAAEEAGPSSPVAPAVPEPATHKGKSRFRYHKQIIGLYTHAYECHTEAHTITRPRKQAHAHTHTDTFAKQHKHVSIYIFVHRPSAISSSLLLTNCRSHSSGINKSDSMTGGARRALLRKMVQIL
jgi:hypothetical protein